MNASCRKLLPLYTPEINNQVIDLPVEKSPLIFITEKEYLELKNEVGYWQAMHKKAIAREKKLKQTIKEQEGQLRINNLRCKEFDQKLPIQWQPASFKKQHEKLIEKMDAIGKERDVFIETHNPDSDLLSSVKYKILTSLQNHWEGLSVNG